MRRQILLRSLLLFVGFVAFGVVDALVRGHHVGVRNTIGNLSATWAIVPVLAGALVLPRRRTHGALAGAVASFLALASYSLVRGGHLDLASLGNRYLIAGLVGGAALGAGAAWLARRGWWSVLAGIVAGLLVLEPAARLLWAVARDVPLGTYTPHPIVWGVEIVGGLAIATYGLRLRRSVHPS
jgi:Family of unknown function (DUF6518)